MFVSAWSKIRTDLKPEWRPWPLREHLANGMSGFYWAFEDVWANRLWKHEKSSSHSEEVSVHVREAACKYIKLQQSIRFNDPNPDVSMAEYLRRGMTEDEKFVDAKIRNLEEKLREIAPIELKTPAIEPPVQGVIPSLDLGLPKDADPAPTDEPAEEWPELAIQPQDQIIEGEFQPTDDGYVREGFVRKGRPLTTKPPE